MAAANSTPRTPASLSALRSTRAAAVVLPDPVDAGQPGTCVAQSPAAMSPWACSTEACSPTWSPVTPAIVSFGARTPQARPMPTPASPFFPESQALKPVPTAGHAHLKPVGSPMAGAASPTLQIRRNAVSFGIPLNARYGDVGAPLPVRTHSGALLEPSPTARGSAAAPALPLAHAAGLPSSRQAARSTAMPIAASHVRRAVGGA